MEVSISQFITFGIFRSAYTANIMIFDDDDDDADDDIKEVMLMMLMILVVITDLLATDFVHP